jgi:hypothetical protein
MKARHKLLTVFSVLGGLMAIAAVGWACTALVGPTYLTDTDSTPSLPSGLDDADDDGDDDTPGAPVASSGGFVSAKGVARHGREPPACDDESGQVGDGTKRCDYELITAEGPVAFSCHYNDGEERTKNDANESHNSPTSGVTELNGTVDAPTASSPEEFVACFRSHETFTGADGDPPAAGTTGAPFLAL